MQNTRINIISSHAISERRDYIRSYTLALPNSTAISSLLFPFSQEYIIVNSKYLGNICFGSIKKEIRQIIVTAGKYYVIFVNKFVNYFILK